MHILKPAGPNPDPNPNPNPASTSSMQVRMEGHAYVWTHGGGHAYTKTCWP